MSCPHTVTRRTPLSIMSIHGVERPWKNPNRRSATSGSQRVGASLEPHVARRRRTSTSQHACRSSAGSCTALFLRVRLGKLPRLMPTKYTHCCHVGQWTCPCLSGNVTAIDRIRKNTKQYSQDANKWNEDLCKITFFHVDLRLQSLMICVPSDKFSLRKTSLSPISSFMNSSFTFGSLPHTRCPTHDRSRLETALRNLDH